MVTAPTAAVGAVCAVWAAQSKLGFACAQPNLPGSQAKELGIECPRLRNGKAIANQNTLIYVLINLRALHRVRRKKAARDSTV